MFSGQFNILASVGFIMVQYLSCLVFFTMLDTFKSGNVITVATDFTRGIVVILGIILFPPLPGPLGWSGISLSIVGSLCFSLTPNAPKSAVAIHGETAEVQNLRVMLNSLLGILLIIVHRITSLHFTSLHFALFT